MEQGRVAFVTGGAGGIGAAICRALAAQGAHVIVADLSMESASRVASEFGATPVEIDVSDPRSVEAAVRKAGEHAPPIGILVNCAGWDELKPFLETDEQFQRKVVDVNLHGPIRVTRDVLPMMVEARWGRVVNIASDAGRVGSSLEAIYSGCKGGLIAFTKAVAREVARHGITVNSVCPGPTQTPLLDSVVASRADGERLVASVTSSIPMRRLATPEEIAEAVAYFCSEGAGFVTGQTLSVSGGLTMS